MRYKKLFAVVMAAVMALAGCSTETPAETSEVTVEVTTTTTAETTVASTTTNAETEDTRPVLCDTIMGMDGVPIDSSNRQVGELGTTFDTFTFYRESTGLIFNDDSYYDLKSEWKKAVPGDSFGSLTVSSVSAVYDPVYGQNTEDHSLGEYYAWDSRRMFLDGTVTLSGVLYADADEQAFWGKNLFFQPTARSLADNNFPILSPISCCLSSDPYYGKGTYEDTQEFYVGNIDDFADIIDWSLYTDEENMIEVYAEVELAGIEISYTTHTGASNIGDATITNIISVGDHEKPTNEPKSDFGYSIYNNTAHVYAYSGSDKDVIIPEYIGEYPVTVVLLPLKVDNDDLDIETVTLSKTVSEVQRPDYWMDRTEKSYYVDDENENFTSVDGVIYSKDRSALFVYPIAREGEFTVPDSVTEICGGAFYGCEKLSVVNIGSSVRTIGVQAFAYSSVSEVNIAEGLESIGWEAFRWTKIESIVLPKTLKTIECRAFEGSALRSVTLPTAIDEFEADVFTMTELSEINLVDNGEGLYMWNDILCKGDELIRMIKGSKVEKLVFDRTLTSLDYVFQNCTNLKVIEIMDGCDFIITMTEFGDFIGCSSIERMYIPGSVVSCPFYHYYQEMSPNLVVYTPEKSENSFDGRWSGEKCKFVYVDSYEDYLKAVDKTE